MKEHDDRLNTQGEQLERSSSQNIPEAFPEFSPREPHHNPIGAIIGTVILFALLILGALYTHGSRLSLTTAEGTSEERTEGESLSQENAEQDDLETLEVELNAFEDVESIGIDLEKTFDAEFVE